MNRNPHVFDNQTDDLFVQPTGGPPQASPLFFFHFIISYRSETILTCWPMFTHYDVPPLPFFVCFFLIQALPPRKKKKKKHFQMNHEKK